MSSSPTTLCLCIAGWHLDLNDYEGLARVPGVDKYVVFHRAPHEIPHAIVNLMGADRIRCEANRGYDWGCYEQFRRTDIWRRYAATIFLHDDIVIRDAGFVEACADLLGRGHSIVGNGRAFEKRDWPRTHPESYAHAQWRPPSSFPHDIVRGSFFAASRAALEQIGSFEVFWDPYLLSMYFGNWSTRASCAKFQAMGGADAFAFLSTEWCRSRYLVEKVRGKEDGELYYSHSAWRRWGGQMTYRSARRYMQTLRSGKTGGARRLSQMFLRRFLRKISACTVA